jgi:hypothetical protein
VTRDLSKFGKNCKPFNKYKYLHKKKKKLQHKTAAVNNNRLQSRLLLKCDGTRAENRFSLSAKRTSPFKSAGESVQSDYWQASRAHQLAGFVLLVQACVLQSCDPYWLPTPFSCFPFTSPPMRHRVPSHFNWTIRRGRTLQLMQVELKDALRANTPLFYCRSGSMQTAQLNNHKNISEILDNLMRGYDNSVRPDFGGA